MRIFKIAAQIKSVSFKNCRHKLIHFAYRQIVAKLRTIHSIQINSFAESMKEMCTPSTFSLHIFYRQIRIILLNEESAGFRFFSTPKRRLIYTIACVGDFDNRRSFFPVHLHVDIHNRFPTVFVGVGFVPSVLCLLPDLRQGVVILRQRKRRQKGKRGQKRRKLFFHVRFLLISPCPTG